MKKRYLLLGLVLFTGDVLHASVAVQLDAGVLRTSTGSTFTGGMLQLIAARTANATFAAPTANSFVGGDTANEFVLASFAFNQGGAGFVTGETSNFINFTYENTTPGNSSTTFDPGDSLLLRWYPSLTLSSSSPGAGTSYGQYRSSSPPNGGLAWAGPADGSTLTGSNGLIFLTSSANGANPDIAGYASNFVASVPEPSSVVLSSAVALLGLLKLRRRG